MFLCESQSNLPELFIKNVARLVVLSKCSLTNISIPIDLLQEKKIDQNLSADFITKWKFYTFLK